MDETTLADGFGALSDVHRLRALRYIAGRAGAAAGQAGQGDAASGEDVCACHVQDHLGLSQPATSYHMKVLREAGLVSAERRGRWVHYRISERGLRTLRDFLTDLGGGAAPAEDAA